MDRTVCELFAGVGGFRCGLNSIDSIEAANKQEKWNTVWFNQWEPGKIRQWAHDCYVNRFGVSLDLKGKDTTNIDIAEVAKADIPDHNLLVGGFPCQDYSVARGLSGEKGIEGKKGVLWWSIRDVIHAKRPPFVLLENVDRLLKSPSKQRGRDFGIILACLQYEGYIVEWRVINAAQYGAAQRRRRTFIFAYKNNTKFAADLKKSIDYIVIHDKGIKENVKVALDTTGFFAKAFPVMEIGAGKIQTIELDTDIVNVSDTFNFLFDNSGIMIDGIIYSVQTTPIEKPPVLLGDILQSGEVNEKYFIPEKRLYYTSPDVKYSDETEKDLPTESRQTWQYLKGGKKRLRTAATGHQYVFSEGPIPMIDRWDAPARTMLTSESSFNRSTHIVKDKRNGKIRILTPIEAERIQGFPDDWTKECLVDDNIVLMPEKMRYFCMGNALVVNLISQLEKELDNIFDNEG
ncbi:MAG: (cytosine-5-)-methyltransferase [Anaerocolumna sp.]|jgi:DNA (cytosine-5)-methyltransferase 1|nr:(cytosine-5-)-methyltransferase [Anaerocolumna sp.]